MIKAAAHSDLPLVEGIMRRIHDEDPSYWPYGLAADQFNGGLYMVKRSFADEPVGFVGWQKFDEGGRDVGYYAIGILPEYRQQGFAKQAVTQVIREIGNQCHEVKAMVMAHNQPSKALARSLSIPMIEKLAMEKEAMGNGAKLALSALTGLGTAGAVDSVTYGDSGVVGKLRGSDAPLDAPAIGDFILNTLAGGAVPYVDSTVGKFMLPLAAQGTTIGFANARNAIRANAIAQDQVKATEGVADAMRTKIPPAALIGAGGLGLGALALLAYNAKRKADFRKEELALKGKGRVRITLPTKDPGDNETEVELPFDDLNLSQALRGRLGRDTRRRLYSETKQRTRRIRKPKDPEQPTPKEREDLELVREEEELDKAATWGNRLQGLVDELGFYKSALQPVPQQAVPTPPQLGQNPALRMTQQDHAVANSIQPSTDANPQIMEAQQAAMQAEQAGAQQMAQMEQASQQAQMQQQQQFQEAMMKSEQEKEVLKLQLEKEKALQELSDAQGKAQADAGKGEGTVAQSIISNRLARLGKRVKSAAAPTVPPAAPTNPVPPDTPGTLDPATGQPIPQPPIYLKPQSAQNYNQGADAAGMMPRPIVAFHSYPGGPVGDFARDMLFRRRLTTPDAPEPAQISRSSMLNTPDRMGMITKLMGGAYDAYAAHNPQFAPNPFLGHLGHLAS
jgi:GNAT superfamily N-acetyltransferase